MRRILLLLLLLDTPDYMQQQEEGLNQPSADRHTPFCCVGYAWLVDCRLILNARKKAKQKSCMDVDVVLREYFLFFRFSQERKPIGAGTHTPYTLGGGGGVMIVRTDGSSIFPFSFFSFSLWGCLIERLSRFSVTSSVVRVHCVILCGNFRNERFVAVGLLSVCFTADDGGTFI